MHTYLINLSERKDRLDKIKLEFEKLNLQFERFDAIKHNIGAIGCTMSHIACLELAKKNNLDYCMICEDDAEFYINRENFDFFVNNFLKDNKLKILNLICNVKQKNTIQKYNSIFNTSNKILTTTCYIIKKEYYNCLISNFEYSKINLLNGGEQSLFALDVTWHILQKKDIFVIPNFKCGNQSESYSDIQKKKVNYNLNVTSTSTSKKTFLSVRDKLLQKSFTEFT